MKIIDAHTHIRFSTPWEDPHLMELARTPEEEIVRQSRAVGIERMVMLGNIIKFGFNPNPEQVRAINEDTQDLVGLFPDFVIPYCYLNPKHSKEDIFAEASHWVRNHGFMAIKLECDCSASDPKMSDLMEVAEELDIPVLQHAWDTRNRGQDRRPDGKEETDGNDVAILASRHPRVRIQMAHLTGVWLHGIEAIRPYENVWADTSGSQPFSNVTEFAVDRLGSDRVIYGSDYPIRDISGSLSKVLSGPFSDEVKEKLCYRNFVTMVGKEY